MVTSVDGHPAGTLVQVTVSAVYPSQLEVDFSDHRQVLTDACVLLCGHVGTRALLDLGYTGPLATRPRLAPNARSSASDFLTPHTAG